MAGIVGYGAYVPRNRIKSAEIARQWGKDPETIRKGLLLEEKSVPGLDEDTITISVAAGRAAVDRARIDPSRIGAVYIGSESHPYAVKPSGTALIEALGIAPEVHVADFEFACKAGTEAMFVALGLVESGRVEYAMGIGADTSQGAPNDALEFSASAGGAAFIFGKQDLLVEVLETYSYTSDTPDFWRREGEFYPRHGGRFTGEPAYFKHVLSATRALLKKSGHKPADFRHAVFHMPNGKFPLQAAKELGFTKEQTAVGWLVPTMGNTYSGSSPTGLAAGLDAGGPRGPDPPPLVRLGRRQRFVRAARDQAAAGAARPGPDGALHARRTAALSHLRRVREVPREDHRQRLAKGVVRCVK